jgi:hypothetical protein
VKIETLEQPVTLCQAAVPIQVCFIVRIDCDANVLSAIFEECHKRWGGRDSLIITIDENGVIDDTYWAWAKSFDPDVVYSYVDLELATLERIEREWMPSNVQIHRRYDDLHVWHEEDVKGLPALSVLPMIKITRPFGPPRTQVLVSKYPTWVSDPFVLDSFGVNPNGPGVGGSELVREHIATMAIGDADHQQAGHIADIGVADTTSLLQLMATNHFDVYTMAQLSGIGYDFVQSSYASKWRFFNIVVGNTTLDRIAFWNSRIGVTGYIRRHITAIRVPEERLDDAEFVAALVSAIPIWASYQNGQAFAQIISSSVPVERLQPLANSLGPKNVHATAATFTGVNDFCFDARERFRSLGARHNERFTETRAPLVPILPPHLSDFGLVPSLFAHGSWVMDVHVRRETGISITDTLPLMPIPRRLQAVRTISKASWAKISLEHDLRIVVDAQRRAQILTFTNDDAQYILSLILPTKADYTMRADVRANRFPQPWVVYGRPSSAGRHLAGLLERMGGLIAAVRAFDDPMWTPIFRELVIPWDSLTDAARDRLVNTLRKRFRGNGEPIVQGEGFIRLAEQVAKLARGLKIPSPVQKFSYFVEKFDATEEAKRVRDHAPPGKAEIHVREEAEKHLSYRRAQRLVNQGYAWTCQRCHHPNWRTVKAIREVVVCDVCEQKHGIEADFEWSFMVDDYVVRGMVDHGLRGVVWALGKLAGYQRFSFAFAPPIELFTSTAGGDKTHGDLDLACIIDGKLCIGEVKESQYDLTETLSDELINLARKLRPDIVVLACPDFAATDRIRAQAQRIKAGVFNLGIDVSIIVGDDPIPQPAPVLALPPAPVDDIVVEDIANPEAQ